VALLVDDHLVRGVGDLSQVSQSYPSTALWYVLDLQRANSVADGLLLTWDNPDEGELGTVIFLLRQDRLQQVFDGDRRQGLCMPSRLSDVDANGELELVSFVDDLGRGDCRTPCEIELRRHFNMPAAWVRVSRFTGDAWTPADSNYPGFYRAVAHTYEQIDHWVNDPMAPGSEECEHVYWLKDKGVFKNWAQRAAAIASQDSAR